MKSRIVYGPILSRRLGRSLGIDVIKNTVSKKNCNYDCIYCQLGHVELKLGSPEDVKEAVTPKEVSESFEKFYKDVEGLDYITFSGTCEPSLNLSLGEMIQSIREISGVPVCVITNSSLMGREDVRKNLSQADLVVATLVSGIEKTWRKIHRPAPCINFQEIIEGLRELAKAGDEKKLALEVMFLESETGEPLNSTDEEVESLIKTIRYICPDEIEVLTISRPPAEKWVNPVSEERLRKIADRFISEFGAEKVRLVLKGKKKKAKVLHRDLEEEVYALLLRRPCTFEQTWQGLNTDPESLRPALEKLLDEGKIEEIGSKNREYYRAK
ncbi:MULTISPECIES: radical SAM protein [Methanosarcina]|uniref:Fe-S oxidoreductase n=2 Tax=Methanosarcina mazei TaxID=2209 RepID=A0A0F8C0Z3_METMZ|nr:MULTISPECIES: radical SAM protein [Methanosarcina]AGF96874.1 Fe-S oxidoreductase [Methanosarcina mazei Tuc01]KKF98393.1 Fe-S oxidoreductase [Methanosarcina mazei]KKF99985.1 Fe-S oxidoreductase [Methanosarcina mazei]KKG06532.1 Fe-S oxidoreductase [Methanosarcina mazei]KKG31092.1 Fe-S oxidoreductase [Methanosarcina mazei]